MLRNISWIRSLPQHGSRMQELLLQVFNLEEPETAAPRTADRRILLPAILDMNAS